MRRQARRVLLTALVVFQTIMLARDVAYGNLIGVGLGATGVALGTWVLIQWERDDRRRADDHDDQ